MCGGPVSVGVPTRQVWGPAPPGRLMPRGAGVRLDEVQLLWYRAEPPKRFGIDPVVLCNAVG